MSWKSWQINQNLLYHDVKDGIINSIIDLDVILHNILRPWDLKFISRFHIYIERL